MDTKTVRVKLPEKVAPQSEEEVSNSFSFKSLYSKYSYVEEFIERKFKSGALGLQTSAELLFAKFFIKKW